MVDLSAQFPEIAGATHRISQLLERLANLDDSSKKDDDTFSDNLTKWGEVKRKVEHQLNLTIGYQDHFKLEERNGDTENLLIWALENVTFSRPMSDKCLVSNLTINFVVGENVLITGPSSAGKQFQNLLMVFLVTNFNCLFLCMIFSKGRQVYFVCFVDYGQSRKET